MSECTPLSCTLPQPAVILIVHAYSTCLQLQCPLHSPLIRRRHLMPPSTMPYPSLAIRADIQLSLQCTAQATSRISGNGTWPMDAVETHPAPGCHRQNDSAHQVLRKCAWPDVSIGGRHSMRLPANGVDIVSIWIMASVLDCAAAARQQQR